MNKQLEIKLTIKGDGISINRSIDENTAAQIISLCIGSGNDGQDAMDVAQSVSMTSGSPSKTARGHLLFYKPSGNQEKILVLAHFLKEVRKIDPFQKDQINELFGEIREKIPAGLSTDFARLLRKDWVAEMMKKDKATNKKRVYFITNTGLDVLANGFATNPVPKRKKAVRRKKARVGK